MKKVDVVLGMQWGDEGKGKIVDVLTPRYEAVARFQVDQMLVIVCISVIRVLCSTPYHQESSAMAPPTSLVMVW